MYVHETGNADDPLGRNHGQPVRSWRKARRNRAGVPESKNLASESVRWPSAAAPVHGPSHDGRTRIGIGPESAGAPAGPRSKRSRSTEAISHAYARDFSKGNGRAFCKWVWD